MISPLLHFTEERERRTTIHDIEDTLKDSEMELTKVDVLKILLGISTKKITAPVYKT